MKQQITYREPGAGAIEFTKYFMTGVRELDELTVKILLEGRLHDQDDKRIKRCDYCGYFWRDPSLRNTRKTCSNECKTGIKTLQRRKQREKQDLLNPKPRKRRLIDDYVWWLEYPYWQNEDSMIKVGWKFEKPHVAKTIDFIEAKNEILGEGNRMKAKRVVNYQGDKRDDF